MNSIENNLEICDLLDSYGEVLTKHQRDILCDYFDENMSYSEIAENYDCSRQSVQDIIKRTVAKLESLEKALNFSKYKKAIRQIVIHQNEFSKLDIIKKLEQLLEMEES